MKWLGCLITLDSSEYNVDRSVINLAEHLEKKNQDFYTDKLRNFSVNMFFGNTEVKEQEEVTIQMKVITHEEEFSRDSWIWLSAFLYYLIVLSSLSVTLIKNKNQLEMKSVQIKTIKDVNNRGNWMWHIWELFSQFFCNSNCSKK